MRGMRAIFVFFVLFALFFLLTYGTVLAKEKTKVKFYNFDDLLVDGKVSKPKLLYIDSRQRVKFEKLLKLKKDFLPKLKETERDPALR
tara:strand:+ start:3397 stop:3660 length:264 start_codon:yes stop_codon:yes gene_type:complete